eukprot:CAMPEP_0119311010 /NCGR_PEP_ID=MMETSP1333-20130426/21198_1 /TAXON_ID=418940 /ORGANISM="Scyphosphaera apsteinii, Strain RCC1455" /LENGTH=257 /DNA_ID=CAMNT_0007315291 /DNA_START=36 /DNA_END=809 /DNA_ORIENTATION=-
MSESTGGAMAGYNVMLQVVFVFLCIEAAVIATLVFPWPTGFRRGLGHWISNSSALSVMSRPLLYFFVLVTLTWLFTTVEMIRLGRVNDTDFARDYATKLLDESRMFRTQRDFYLVGFSALLIPVISRLYKLFKEVNQLQANKEALQKQAEQAVAAFKNLQSENEDLDKKLKKVTPGVEAKEAIAEADSVPDEVKALQERIKEAEGERDQANKNAEALKKQAAGLTAEYARITKEKESLENKLADFEDLMGDALKKSK